MKSKKNQALVGWLLSLAAVVGLTLGVTWAVRKRRRRKEEHRKRLLQGCVSDSEGAGSGAEQSLPGGAHEKDGTKRKAALKGAPKSGVFYSILHVYGGMQGAGSPSSPAASPVNDDDIGATVSPRPRASSEHSPRSTRRPPAFERSRFKSQQGQGSGEQRRSSSRYLGSSSSSSRVVRRPPASAARFDTADDDAATSSSASSSRRIPRSSSVSSLSGDVRGTVPLYRRRHAAAAAASAESDQLPEAYRSSSASPSYYSRSSRAVTEAPVPRLALRAARDRDLGRDGVSMDPYTSDSLDLTDDFESPPSSARSVAELSGGAGRKPHGLADRHTVRRVRSDGDEAEEDGEDEETYGRWGGRRGDDPESDGLESRRRRYREEQGLTPSRRRMRGYRSSSSRHSQRFSSSHAEEMRPHSPEDRSGSSSPPPAPPALVVPTRPVLQPAEVSPEEQRAARLRLLGAGAAVAPVQRHI